MLSQLLSSEYDGGEIFKGLLFFIAAGFLIFVIFFGGFFSRWLKRKEADRERHERWKKEDEERLLKAEKEKSRIKQIQIWAQEKYIFKNTDINNVCNNLIAQIKEGNFSTNFYRLIDTLFYFYPVINELYRELGIYDYDKNHNYMKRYYQYECDILNAIKSILIENEKIEVTDANIIKCYLSIRDVFYINFAKQIEQEFNLSTDNYLYDYLNNDLIIPTEFSNILKLAIFEKVHTNSKLFISEQCSSIRKKINDRQQSIKQNEIRKNLLSGTDISKADTKLTLDDIDFMSGVMFERFLGEKFKERGYQVEYTKASGDQGIDLILTKNNQKTGVQAKCYSQKLSNSAVQEAVAGKSFYHLDRVIVITNNYFTQGAKELAASNNVILWDRDALKEKFFND